MGKDRTGKFHPPKGKPSGAYKEEGLGVSVTPPEKLDEYLEITDKYTEGADKLSSAVPVRHPNRNTSKVNSSRAYGAKTSGGTDNNEENVKERKEGYRDQSDYMEPAELPGRINKQIFSELAGYSADLCISIYIPTHASGVEVNEQKDAILFKNQLQKLEKMLIERNVARPVIEEILAPCYELQKNDEFWRSQSAALGLFISEGFFKFIKMPTAVNEQILINSSFLVAPLVPLMMSYEYFYLLAISKHQCKLFRADAFGIDFIPVEDLPHGIEEVKRISELDATTWRTGGRGGTGGANFHGIGGGNPDDKTNTAVYYEAVDDILFKQVFNKENVPLVLAGVEYQIPIYRSVCDYHNVWPDALTGSYEHIDNATLFTQSRQLMEPYFRKRQLKVLELYGNQSATQLTSSIIADIIPAAWYGRIAQLFVSEGEHIWGRFDEVSNQLELHEHQQENSEDLLDKAVIKTITQGGEVFLLNKDEMPADSPAAALMRY